MDYLFLHRDKRTFTSERQKNLLFRAARIYWEQKFANCEPEKARKVDCELYKYLKFPTQINR
ncbi:hypothetical protein [Phocaeicola massiliensis]|uniref:hypothetical protein n=1 Tax=Phocaeicola massiliensis TaxID=204516 RepID=UPI0021A9B166|nr:hypothetical protein [Phocaeicola massiliensis]